MITRIISIIFVILITTSTTEASDIERPSTVKKTYYANTEFPLVAYYVYGRQDGPTALIIGGIQGDEPGGYLAAEALTNLTLAKGNLIVIPRTNRNAVAENVRGIDFDMNRLFSDLSDENPQAETDSERAIKKIVELMASADLFLNLHDGYGFHKDRYINEIHNENRFGQSVIIDIDEYSCNDKTFTLMANANHVLKRVNEKIPNNMYHLYLFNTRTTEPDSKHKSMLKASTWYALSKLCVPAYAIEGSKNTRNISERVRYHLYAVKEFLDLYNIEYEIEPVTNNEPKLISAIINIDGKGYVINENNSIYIKPEKLLEIVYIDSNFRQGITVDILEYGSYNDINKSFVIGKNTTIVLKKDNKIFAQIPVNVDKALSTEVSVIGNKGTRNLTSQQFAEVFNVTNYILASAMQNNTSDQNTLISFQSLRDKYTNGNNYNTVRVAPKKIKPKIVAKTDSTKINIMPEAKPDKPKKLENINSYNSKYVFLIEVDKKRMFVKDGETLKLETPYKINLIETYKRDNDGKYQPLDLIINFKGWYPEGTGNNGDDRGYIVNIPNSRFMKKYSIIKGKNTYPVEAKNRNKSIANFFIEF